MSMNIGPMIRALLGDSAPSEGKTLELRIGQIVRGVLMEMLDNGEALMNINGVSVRAKLEAELPVGRGTLLQVQPSGSGGTVMLKPLQETSDAMPDEGLKDVLKSFGLPDQKWSYELVRGLKRDGYSVDKATGDYFLSAAALKPASADAASWMAAAGVAFRRGLAATEETIASLRQSLSGRPIHEELASFASSLKEWLGSEGAKSDGMTALAARLQALVAEGDDLLAEGETQLRGEGLPMSAQGKGDAVGSDTAPVSNGRTSFHARPAPSISGTAAMPVSMGEHPAAAGWPGLAAGQAGGASAPASSQAARPLQASAAQTVPVAPVVAEGAADAEDAAPVARPQAGASEQGASAGNASQASTKGESAWIGRFLQWLGAGHEHRLANAAEPRLPLDPSLTPDSQAPSAEGRPHAAETAKHAADTLKSALLSLVAHDETPPALRDAAQSLIHQISGQQLLVSSERQVNQPYSLVTLFVPMKGQDGDTTAAVHVQTRRGRKGEWDTDNCRLLFDLKMRNLGDTVVDVQVVDRIVSVKLMNDFPGMADLVEQAKGEVGAALGAAGFQLLSMTARPLPTPIDASVSQTGEGAARSDNPAASAYAAKPYKGVDFRA
ncbi:hypothetical protein [Cohnella candidum]|uniref:Flagellar hook-length control protein FliK n=1 Tax=Cohnella candidum TaxID=2674991 RepID=A0A3G3JUQ5_9BACL|nr:hypothetical protein [Cohnella candidum]AYQ71962.1 hypothetical protein EAV92_04910 [Cohnella candidum]